jgi:diguanylate cyclase (GGDEF)-like protein
MSDPSRSPVSRASLALELQHAIMECQSAGECLALLVVQINQLQRVENALGVDAGSAANDEFCSRVGQMLRNRDQLHNVGDCKFWLVLRGTRNEGHALLAANKLQRIGQEPFLLESHAVKLESSIGIAMYPQHGGDASELLRRAELALLNAKDSGRHIQVYCDDSARSIAHEWEVEIELEQALEENELELFFQPQFALPSRQPCGAEALLRWRHPVRGLLAPSAFMPAAERSGKLEAITWHVLDCAQRQRQEWPERFGGMPVSINVPPAVLDTGRLIDSIESSVRIWGSNHCHLTIEITEESVVRNRAGSFAALARLREMGVGVSIDDFGTGYSSMAYFKDLPADELKIDMSFIRDLHQDKANQHIVRAIIDLAHSFSFKVVAEGVEHEEVLRLLIDMGCDTVQGFHLSPPMSHPDFCAWLSDYKVPKKSRWRVGR